MDAYETFSDISNLELIFQFQIKETDSDVLKELKQAFLQIKNCYITLKGGVKDMDPKVIEKKYN